MNYKIVDIEKDEVIGVLNDEEVFGSVYVLIFEDLYKGFKKNKDNFHYALNVGWALTEIENGTFTIEQLIEFFNTYFHDAFRLEETQQSQEELEKQIQNNQSSKLVS